MKRSKFIIFAPLAIFFVVLVLFSASISRVSGKAASLMPFLTLTPTKTPSGMDPYGYLFCANENTICSLPGSGSYSVRYGANNQYVYKTLSGQFDCSNATFPDPIYGAAKQCSYIPVPKPGTTSWSICTKENGPLCTFTGTTVIAYGTINSNENFFGVIVINDPNAPPGGIACNSQNFNNSDPVPGVRKVCMVAQTLAGGGTTAVWGQRCAAEWIACSNYGRIYAYGSADAFYVYKRYDQIGGAGDPGFICGSQAFNINPPIPGASCYAIAKVGLDSGGWIQCGKENGTCYLDGSRMVAFGAGNTYNYSRATGEIACNTATFGDPAVGTTKACYVYRVAAP